MASTREPEDDGAEARDDEIGRQARDYQQEVIDDSPALTDESDVRVVFDEDAGAFFPELTRTGSRSLERYQQDLIRDEVASEHDELDEEDVFVSGSDGDFEINISDEGQARLQGLYLEDDDSMRIDGMSVRERQMTDIREGVADRYSAVEPEDVILNVDDNIVTPEIEATGGQLHLYSDDDLIAGEGRTARELQQEMVAETVAAEDDDLEASDIQATITDQGIDYGISPQAQQRLIAEDVAAEQDGVEPEDVLVSRDADGYHYEVMTGDEESRIPSIIGGERVDDALRGRSDRWVDASDWVGSQAARPAGYVDDALATDIPLVDQSVYGATIGDRRPVETGTQAVVSGVGKAADPFMITYGGKRLADTGLYVHDGALQSFIQRDQSQLTDRLEDTSDAGQSVAGGVVESTRERPVETGGIVVGGLLVGGAASVGARTAAGGASAGSISGATTRVRSSISEARAQSPSVQIVRDADAGLVDVTGSLGIRSRVTDAAPSTPSRPTMSRQALADSAFRSRSRLARDIRSTQVGLQYQLSRVRDRDLSGPGGLGINQQMVNDAAFRAGFRTQQNITRTQAQMAYLQSIAGRSSVGTPALSRPSLPSQQAINDAMFRAGYRYQDGVQQTMAADSLRLATAPTQSPARDALWRTRDRVEHRLSTVPSDASYQISRLRDRDAPSTPDVLPSQQAINDAMFRAGYRYESDVAGAMALDRYQMGQAAISADSITDLFSTSGRVSAGASRLRSAPGSMLESVGTTASSLRTLPSELTIRVDPGRPPRQDRTIDLSQVTGVDVGDITPATQIDTIRRSDSDAPRGTPGVDADVSGPTPAGGLSMTPSPQSGQQAVLRSPETGPLARDPVATHSSGMTGDLVTGFSSATLPTLGSASIAGEEAMQSTAQASMLDSATLTPTLLDTAQTPTLAQSSQTRTGTRTPTTTRSVVSQRTVTPTRITGITTLPPITTTTPATPRPPQSPPPRTPRPPLFPDSPDYPPRQRSEDPLGVDGDTWETGFADADDLMGELGGGDSLSSELDFGESQVPEVRW